MSDTLDNAIWALNSAQTAVQIPRPTGQLRMIVTGDLPSSSTDETSVLCALMQGETLLFRCAASMAWQGQSSMGDPKHNFKLSFSNETSGDDFYVKVGSWIPIKKVDLKAYGQGPTSNYGNSDRSMIRDTTAGKLWRNIRRASTYPDSLIAPFHAMSYDAAINGGLNSGALFSTEGFPCALYVGSTFYGLYVFRSTAPNGDYLIDKNNAMHYLLQPAHLHGTGNGSWFNFDSTQWDISSPKLKGYSSQDDISSKFPKQYAVINRLISYFADVYSGADTLANAYQYINIRSWIDYLIFCEVSGSNDAYLNNVMLVSWDATQTSGLWHVCPYDLDETFGILFGHTATSSGVDPMKMGFCWGTSANGTGIFYIMAQYFQDEIKRRYAELRDISVISTSAVWSLACESINLMDQNDVAADYALWGTNDQASPAWMLNWINGRIAWLDQKWGYSG